ncbi:hypothetical protein [Erythrobacter sp. WG]|uniref:hypothetical protein n=1 Tax=Erythrobacter sp. WG TaxID=2985510 RepID=UPI00226D5176|nr:hypothetical protein [Erythrobacter sp. WG]MCX9146976.1 hypothetical protein [Erythrobacter sp. WG]
MAGGALLAGLCAVLMIRRIGAARRQETRHAANLFAVRELAPYVLGEGPVDCDHLSIQSLRYPDLVVIVVNDGSKDRTMAILHETFDLLAAQREIDRALHGCR